MHRGGSSEASPPERIGGVLLKERIMIRTHTLLALAALALPAVATAAPDRPSMAVEVSDLDLASQEGQSRLALRIHRAARAMCKAEALTSLPQSVRGERQCIRETIARTEGAVQAAMAAGDPEAGRGG